MITLEIKDLKTKSTSIVSFKSKDEAEKVLRGLITNPDVITKEPKITKGKYLESYCFDTKAEQSLIEEYLPEERKIQGHD